MIYITDNFLKEFQQHYLLSTFKCYFFLFHGFYARNFSVTGLSLFTELSDRDAVLFALFQQEA